MTRPTSSVLDHVSNPRNSVKMDSPDAIGYADLAGSAPRCWIHLRRVGDAVTCATFQAQGCGYSIACCSALTELASNSTIDECRKINASDIEQALEGLPDNKRFCGDLAVQALRDALDQLD